MKRQAVALTSSNAQKPVALVFEPPALETSAGMRVGLLEI